MDDVIYDDDGAIDWNANGWPEPNLGAETNYDGYSADGMPDDLFDIWLDECQQLSDWGIDD